MRNQVLALDLGSTSGFAIVDPEYGLETCGEFKLKGENRAQKLAEYDRWLHEQISSMENLRFVIYERPFTRGLPATRMLWGFAGVAEVVATQHGLPVLDELPTTVKKYSCGSGKASKEDMIKAATMFCGLNDLREHEADAILLGKYALDNLME